MGDIFGSIGDPKVGMSDRFIGDAEEGVGVGEGTEASSFPGSAKVCKEQEKRRIGEECGHGEVWGESDGQDGERDKLRYCADSSEHALIESSFDLSDAVREGGNAGDGHVIVALHVPLISMSHLRRTTKLEETVQHLASKRCADLRADFGLHKRGITSTDGFDGRCKQTHEAHHEGRIASIAGDIEERSATPDEGEGPCGQGQESMAERVHSRSRSEGGTWEGTSKHL